MANSWLEALEEKRKEDNSHAKIAAIDSSETVDDFEEFDDVEETQLNSLPKKKDRRQLGVLLGGLVVLSLAAGALGVAVFTGGAKSEELAETPQLTSSEEINDSVDPKLAKPAKFGSACGTETKDIATENSIRGATVEFEQAYFLNDVDRLVNVTTPESALRKQDWKKVLPAAAPKGTTWCAELGPIKDDAASVDLDLTMNVPDKNPVKYRQTVAGQNTANGWKVVSLTARPEG